MRPHHSPESQPKVYRHQFRAERLPPPISSKIRSSCLIGLTSRNGAQGGIRTLDFRVRDGCSASTWTAPDGSRLLTLDAASVQGAPDGSRRIVWMIIGMIKGHRQEI